MVEPVFGEAFPLVLLAVVGFLAIAIGGIASAVLRQRWTLKAIGLDILVGLIAAWIAAYLGIYTLVIISYLGLLGRAGSLVWGIAVLSIAVLSVAGRHLWAQHSKSLGPRPTHQGANDAEREC